MSPHSSKSNGNFELKLVYVGVDRTGGKGRGEVNNTAATEAFQSDLQYCFLSARMEATAEG